MLNISGFYTGVWIKIGEFNISFKKDKVGSTNLILKLGLTLVKDYSRKSGFPKTKIDCRESLFPGGKWVKLF